MRAVDGSYRQTPALGFTNCLVLKIARKDGCPSYSRPLNLAAR